MYAELMGLIGSFEADPSIRAIVITGTPPAFSVGGDATALAGHADRGTYDPGPVDTVTRPGTSGLAGFDAELAWLANVKLPVIAAVNGACAGVALALVAFCDLRFGAAPAKLTTAAPKLGLPAEYGLSWILPKLIGATRANDLLLSGRTVTVADTAEWGLWNRVADDGESALTSAHDYAHTLAATCGPRAVASTKQQIWADLAGRSAQASVDDSLARLDRAMGTAEYREGIKAFSERRAPNFSPE